MSDQPLSLDHLYRAIEAQITQHVPGVEWVSFWPDISDHIPLPAVFLDIAEIEPGEDIGTGDWLAGQSCVDSGDVRAAGTAVPVSRGR